MNIKKNKKGEGIAFFGGHVVNLVITVIIVVILVFFGTKVYGSFTGSNELEKAANQLEKIADVVKTVQQTGEESRTEFFPIKNWFLVTFPDYDFPDGECRDSKIFSCLCICEDIDCNVKRICEGFEFDVKVDSVYNDNYIVTSKEIPEVLRTIQSAYELKIFKEGNTVKIRR